MGVPRIPATCNPYGWKARIGLVIPSTNTVNEPEFWTLAPTGVTIHTARVLAAGPSDRDAFVRMEQALDLAAEQLATAEIDVLAYGCTTGSIVCPLPELVSRMTRITGVPALTTAGAVVAALRAFGARRIAVGTPYNDFLNDSEERFLLDCGFDITSFAALRLGEGESRRLIGQVPPEAVYRLARQIDRPHAEALFLSCTNLATLDVIEAIERDLGKPVVTSNQATLWACLRVLGLSMPIAGYGRLLQDHLARIEPAALLAAPSGDVGGSPSDPRIPC